VCLLYFYTTQILTSTTVSIKCISWLIKAVNKSDPLSLSMKITVFSVTIPFSLTYTHSGPTDDTQLLNCTSIFITHLYSADSKILRNMTNFAHTSWLRIPDDCSFLGTAVRTWIIFILILIAIFPSFYLLYFFYTIITNVMHWILFIRKILLLSSTYFEYQVLIFRRT